MLSVHKLHNYEKSCQPVCYTFYKAFAGIQNIACLLFRQSIATATLISAFFIIGCKNSWGSLLNILWMIYTTTDHTAWALPTSCNNQILSQLMEYAGLSLDLSTTGHPSSPTQHPRPPPPSIDYLYHHHSQASWFHLMSLTIHTPHIQHAHCTLYYCDKITLEHTCRHMCTCIHTCMAMDVSISAKDTLVGCCCDPVSSWYHLSMLVYSPGFLLLWAGPSWYPCPESACQ